MRAVKGSGPGVDHLEKDNHIHVFHTVGVRGLDTGGFFAGAGQFPERSMERVPLSNLLADIHFIQKWWYHPDERQIVFYEVSFRPIRWVPSPQVVEHLLGAQGMHDLKAIIDGEIRRAQSRPDDIVPYGAAYRKYQGEKDRKLNAMEKEDVYRVLGAFIGPIKAETGKYAPNGKTEKAEVIARLPALKAKVDAAAPTEWADIRTEAIRPLG